MPALEHCTIEHLAGVFAAAHEEIVAEWRLQAGVLLKELALDKPTMTDHLPDVIAEITRDLALGRDGTLSVEHTRGSPPVHGVQRFHDGLDVGEVVAEYNLLRTAFITVAERHQLYVVGDAARIINHRIDEAVRMAVTAFADQQGLIRKKQEDQHLAFIVHDLRTPLHAASLVAQELQESADPATRGGPDDLFELLNRNLRRIQELITRSLHDKLQAVATSSSFRPERRVFELWPLVQRLLLDLRAVAVKNNIEVLNKIPPPLTVYADAGLISQVFQNLLSNAFRYTAGGRIVISASAEAGFVTCRVRDSGAGIPPEILSNAFDPLVTDPNETGTGLGLAIVKQIIQAHDGTVAVESTLGDGALFVFTLPTAAEEQRVFEATHDDWLWCALCARCSRQADLSPGSDLLSQCSYEDCDGKLAYHGWLWKAVRQRHPEFPEIPERGVCYAGPLREQVPVRGPCSPETDDL